ncbi:uncharacterized protein LOC141642370 [Silene latifolia]|uniref:uncharacterized protein LOC141642370 n=1 Tax=Silene latifolia TaxID=37657 RepID=UPI003D76F1E0
MSDIGYSVADNLPPHLLWEILTRLTCMKSAMRCKAVCKSWLSVILSPQFMGRLLRKHVYGKNHEAINMSPLPPFGLVIRPNLFGTSKGQLLYPKNMKFGLLGHFLPNLFSTITSDDGPQVKVTATCNDMILCEEDRFKQSDRMYICNARTRKWIALPRPGRSYRRFFVGFACDPYNCKDDEQVMEYSVVMVNCEDRGYVKNPFQFEIQIFSSLIGKWKEFTLSLPKSFKTCFSCCSLFNDGMLYFYDSCFGMIAFDPKISDNEKEKGDDKLSIACHFIDWPLDFVTNALEMDMTACLCQGNLRLIQKKGALLSVWDLKDHGTSEWQVKYKVVLVDRDSHDFSRFLFAWNGPLSLLGFQPLDDVTLYICLNDKIVTCNLKTVRLGAVFTIPDESKTFLPNCRSFDIFRPFWISL